MYRLKYISMFLIVSFLSACGNSSKSKEVTTLKDNIWMAKSCEVDTSTMFNANYSYTYHDYYKIAYVFKENTIIKRRTEYDKNCTNIIKSASEEKLSFTYYDLGLKENKNAYDIYDIKLEEDAEEKDAFYAISHNKLCFSKSIYSFEPYTGNFPNGGSYTYVGHGLDFYSDRDNNIIDYENCLVRR